jgi:hypothetical protein
MHFQSSGFSNDRPPPIGRHRAASIGRCQGVSAQLPGGRRQDILALGREVRSLAGAKPVAAVRAMTMDGLLRLS